MTDLKNRVVLISGASAGIGEACAHTFAESGAKLVLVARRIDKLRKLSDALKSDCHLIELDIQDSEAVEQSIQDLPDEFKDIDVLVNNAGLGRGLEKLHEGTIAGWEEMIDTNIKGLLYLSRAVIPQMVSRGCGHIINVGSIAGHEVYPGGNVYCATKFAVDALTKGMRIDLVDTPLRVSTVDPGLVETEFSNVRFYGDTERAGMTYQGYKPLESRDVADAIVWVATRPQHVQIAEVIIMPTDQASVSSLNKK